MSLFATISAQAAKAKQAAVYLRQLDTTAKNQALSAMAQALLDNEDTILAANVQDLNNGKATGLSAALLDRLSLDHDRIAGMASGIKEIAALPDPVGQMLKMVKRPNGLDIQKIRTPLGVIGIIYEARPNVTADAAALCLKAGNAVLLKGGGESRLSNRAIASSLIAAAEINGIPAGSIAFIDSADREAGMIMMRMPEYLDVLIPRGGKGLMQSVRMNSQVPTIMTGMGVCHLYVDDDADFTKAARIIMNAKVQRPSVCNALETLLIHQKAAPVFLPQIVEQLTQVGVELRGCERARAVCPQLQTAMDQDWDEEYLDLILAIRIVDDLDMALAHIAAHSTGHSEAIVSESYSTVRKFMASVDAAAVYANASTRFTDGGEFGMGAEMGISTQKLHVRGPMGLEELTTCKYVIYGDGQIR